MTKRKQYKRPKKLYDKPRIEEENDLVKKYGLKNKREVWKAEFAIGKIRKSAKKLIAASEEEKESFIKRQESKGFKIETIADVLSLSKEDYLKRRLQSIVVKKGLATTPRQARQFITHGHITINKNKINSPSHLTTIEEEENTGLVLVKPIKKPEITNKEKEILDKIKGKSKGAPEEGEGEEESKEEGEK